jgi:hypothetical protein
MIEFREFEYLSMGNLMDDMKQKIEGSGPAFTGLAGGKVVGFAGVVILWPGVGDGWIMAAEAISKHKLWFVRSVKKYLDLIMHNHNLHRVQTTVLHGHTDLIRLVEFLGMRFEGRLIGFGPQGEDYLMYGRVSYV